MYKAELKKEIDDAFSEMQEVTRKISDWLTIFSTSARYEEILKQIIILRKKWLKAAKKYRETSREYYVMYSVPMLTHYRQFKIRRG